MAPLSVEQQIVGYFRARGFSINNAAGIAGNAYKESSYNVHEPGGGLFQFTPSNGMEAKSLGEQCERVWNDLRTGYHGLYDEMAKASTPQRAAWLFMRYYERPKGSQPGEERYAYIADAPTREAAAARAAAIAKGIPASSLPIVGSVSAPKVVHVSSQPDPKDRSPKIRETGRKLSEAGNHFGGHRNALRGVLATTIKLRTK